MKLQSPLSALITAAFLCTTLGSVIYSESAIAEGYADAFVECQKIQPGSNNFSLREMREKSTCFEDLLIKIDGKKVAWSMCEGIRESSDPRNALKRYTSQQIRKDCFRDAAWNLLSYAEKDSVPPMMQPNMDNTDDPTYDNDMDQPTTAAPLDDRGGRAKECDALARKMTSVKANQVNTQAARDLFAKYARLCN